MAIVVMAMVLASGEPQAGRASDKPMGGTIASTCCALHNTWLTLCADSCNEVSID